MTAITDAALADAERIVREYRSGRIKSTSLHFEMFGRPCPHLPTEVEAAVKHACEAHGIWLDSESPEGGRGLPDTDPIKYAHDCRVLLDEALAGLVTAADAHTASRNANRSAA